MKWRTWGSSKRPEPPGRWVVMCCRVLQKNFTLCTMTYPPATQRCVLRVCIRVGCSARALASSWSRQPKMATLIFWLVDHSRSRDLDVSLGDRRSRLEESRPSKTQARKVHVVDLHYRWKCHRSELPSLHAKLKFSLGFAVPWTSTVSRWFCWNSVGPCGGDEFTIFSPQYGGGMRTDPRSQLMVACRILKQKFAVPFATLLIAFVFCEYAIYFVVLSRCAWPELGSDAVRALVLADPHILGSAHGAWIDRLRREWQMERAFQTALSLFDPDVVFILGDLFDEGAISDDAVGVLRLDFLTAPWRHTCVSLSMHGPRQGAISGHGGGEGDGEWEGREGKVHSCLLTMVTTVGVKGERASTLNNHSIWFERFFHKIRWWKALRSKSTGRWSNRQLKKGVCH